MPAPLAEQFQERIGRLPLWGWVLIATAAGLLLRSYLVMTYSLVTDDGATLGAIARDWPAMVEERFRRGHLPLFFLMFKSWVLLTGDSLFTLRLPSLALSALTFPIIALLAHTLGGKRAVLWALAINLLHGTTLRWSAELRMYSFLILGGAALTWLILRRLEDRGRPFWPVLLLHVFLLHLHLSAALATTCLFIGAAISGALIKVPASWWKRFAASYFIPAATLIPLLITMSRQLDSREYEKFEFVPGFPYLVRTLFQVIAGPGGGEQGWKLALIVFVLPAMAVWFVVKRGETPVALILPCLAIGCLPATLAWFASIAGYGAMSYSRYFFMGALPLLGVLAAGAGQLKFTNNWQVTALSAIFLVSMGIFLRSIVQQAEYYILERDYEYDHAARVILDSSVRPAAVLLPPNESVLHIYLYYLRNAEGLTFIHPGEAIPEETTTAFSLLHEDGPSDIQIALTNDPRMELVREEITQRVRVMKFVRND